MLELFIDRSLCLRRTNSFQPGVIGGKDHGSQSYDGSMLSSCSDELNMTIKYDM